MPNSKLNTTIQAILACLLWSSAFVGIKIGLPYTTPLQFAGIRFFISGLMVLPLAIYFNPGFLKIFSRNIRFILLLGLLQTSIQYALFYTGISKVPGSIGAIVIGSSPLFIALVAHYLMPDDKLSWKKVGIIMFGFSGIVLVSMGGDSRSSGAIQLIGIIILIGNNIISGFTNVIIALEKRKIPPMILSSGSMIIGGLFLFLFSIPVEGLNFSPKPGEYYFSLAWLSILSAVAITIWITLLKQPAVVVSDLNLWKFLIPIAGALMAWLILPEESPDWLSVAGMLVAGGSLLLLNMKGSIISLRKKYEE